MSKSARGSAPSLYGTSQDDLAFMPDAAAAVRRRGSQFAYLLSFTVFLALVIGLVWAHFAILDEVTRGEGQVVPSSRIQVIQNLEGGILADVLVREGEIVEPGTVLVRIDNIQAASSYRDVRTQYLSAMADVARLEAEVTGEAAIAFPDELVDSAPEIAAAQQRLFDTRRTQRDAQLAILRTQAEQRAQEIAELESRRGQLGASLKLAREQRSIAQPLVAQGIYPRIDFIKLERDVQQLEGELESVNLSIPRARSALREAEERAKAQAEDFRREAAEDLNRRRLDMRSLKESAVAGADKVTRTEVRAPLRGTVKRIYQTTIGGVIKPGEDIMELVPLDDTLLIEARIRPADVAFLHPGQPAMIKISAYDFSIYGGLKGHLEQISADTIKDENGDSFYIIRLRTEENSLQRGEQVLPIIPGMVASVDILTGKKSVLDYILKPILKARERALRER